MPFVLHSVSFLKPGGRLGLVLPAELLTVNYAAPAAGPSSWRRFRRCVWQHLTSRFFPRCKKRSSFFWPMAGRRGHARLLPGSSATILPRDLPRASWRVLPAPFGRRAAGRGFSPAEELTRFPRWAGLRARARFVSLSQWGTLSLGAVTGNDSFFVLNRERQEVRGQWGLASDDVLRLCPPGLQRHLRRLAYTEKDEGAAAERGARGLSLSPWR